MCIQLIPCLYRYPIRDLLEAAELFLFIVIFKIFCAVQPWDYISGIQPIFSDLFLLHLSEQPDTDSDFTLFCSSSCLTLTDNIAPGWLCVSWNGCFPFRAIHIHKDNTMRKVGWWAQKCSMMVVDGQ